MASNDLGLRMETEIGVNQPVILIEYLSSRHYRSVTQCGLEINILVDIEKTINLQKGDS